MKSTPEEKRARWPWGMLTDRPSGVLQVVISRLHPAAKERDEYTELGVYDSHAEAIYAIAKTQE
jgi:hypothetical protein